ncbi:GlyGly-CTERM sorting domain-containing protein, partial [Photobacterium sp. ZSDE20]|nr:GlyGly-CTERM sorting domain-containing protein [Photobacterium sp. ZSDE20]
AGIYTSTFEVAIQNISEQEQLIAPYLSDSEFFEIETNNCPELLERYDNCELTVSINPDQVLLENGESFNSELVLNSEKNIPLKLEVSEEEEDNEKPTTPPSESKSGASLSMFSILFLALFGFMRRKSH